MLRMRNVWMPIQRRSITMSTMSSRRSSIVFYAIVASSEMRHTIHSVNANIENELSSPQNDRHRLHGIRCILWNGISVIFLLFTVFLILLYGGGGSRIKYPCSLRAQTMLHMRIDWVESESTLSIHLVKVFSQICFSAKVAPHKQIRIRSIISRIGLNSSSLIARR